MIRAHEQLGGIEGLPSGGHRLEVDQPTVVLAGQRPDRGASEDLGPEANGVRQVVHDEGVLGADVTAGDTVTAEGAGPLLDPGSIAAVLEADIDRRVVELPAPETVVRTFERRIFGERRGCCRIRNCPQHCFRAGEGLGKTGGAVTADLGRPSWVSEHPRFRPERDVGVDERGPAKPAADKDIDVVVHAKIVEPCTAQGWHRGKIDLHLAQGLGFGVRIFAGEKFPAPLEQTHRLPGARQARGGDRPAVSGPDDHHAVVRLHLIEGERQAIHERCSTRKEKS